MLLKRSDSFSAENIVGKETNVYSKMIRVIKICSIIVASNSICNQVFGDPNLINATRGLILLIRYISVEWSLWSYVLAQIYSIKHVLSIDFVNYVVFTMERNICAQA